MLGAKDSSFSTPQQNPKPSPDLKREITPPADHATIRTPVVAPPVLHIHTLKGSLSHQLLPLSSCLWNKVTKPSTLGTTRFALFGGRHC